MADWRRIDDDLPDWHDVGKTVEVEDGAGEVCRGELEAEAWFNGEDEIPIMTVAGRSLHDFDRWRVVDAQ